MRIRLRPDLEQRLAKDTEVHAAVVARAGAAASEAQRIGRAGSRRYRAAATPAPRGARIEANAVSRWNINQAGWIEFGKGGTDPTPARAPLRKGAEAAGLKVKL